MTVHLTERMRKTFALWRGTDKDGERDAARAALEKMASGIGATFEDLRRADEGERASSAGRSANFFDGFDDFMEARESGYKAKRAREKAEKVSARAMRRKALLERFGSAEAISAPCERERLIHAALKPWRTVRAQPFERWTDQLDGWSDPGSKPPPHIDDAIRTAYPLPTTFAEARAEFDYWQARERELADAENQDLSGEELDLAAYWRMRIVERLIESELVAKDAADLLVRFQLYREREYHDHAAETVIFNDLERIVSEAAANVSNADRSATVDEHIASGARATVQHGQIEAAILSDPSRSDRSVAREFHCSPTTVGKIRKGINLSRPFRSVQRGGRIYVMKFAASQFEMGARQ